MASPVVAVREIERASRSLDLRLKLLAGGSARENAISDPRIQKLGLGAAGSTEHLRPGRVVVAGETEMRYLASLGARRADLVVRRITDQAIAFLVVTRGIRPPALLVSRCEAKGIPLYSTPHLTSELIPRLALYLDQRLAPRTLKHGVLVDIFGIGMLILGEGGVGKSEAALDLILRGHRLVADDVVEIYKVQPRTLVGRSPQMLRHHMEIRGLGILNIKDLFGVTAVTERKEIQLVVELVQWNPEAEVERLGIDEHRTSILGVELPFLRLPVSAGRNMASILEVAARNQMIKRLGLHTAIDFHRRLLKRLRRGGGAAEETPPPSVRDLRGSP